MTHEPDGMPDQQLSDVNCTPLSAASGPCSSQSKACAWLPWSKRRLQRHHIDIALHKYSVEAEHCTIMECKQPGTGARTFEELLARSSLGAPHVQAACKRTSEATVAQIFERVRGLYEASGHISSAEPSRRWRTEQIAMAGKKSGETTSSKVASKASKILSNPRSGAAAKSVAASALTQAANKGKKGK